ncbi:MAG: hypothetical protein KJN89_13740 [Gammaproteobacteria bacterium]|nr:hypothetical protein [Gammaproteobacteria bacterium]MBT8134299.1 hypothetical protein [Gammaproteobacteria bacterium]NNJ51433.1 hypothetical protein [Gammaproteobacteria bacterium]
MPVLATIATINFLFPSSDEGAASFLSPYVLKTRCEEEIEDTDKRQQAVELTEQLHRLAAQYQEAVVATVENYVDESVKWESSADGLIEALEPWDDSRRETLQEIVRVRQSMHDLLTTEQWNRVFG